MTLVLFRHMPALPVTVRRSALGCLRRVKAADLGPNTRSRARVVTAIDTAPIAKAPRARVTQPLTGDASAAYRPRTAGPRRGGFSSTLAAPAMISLESKASVGEPSRQRCQ
jgi:hypothetical protein